MDFLDKLKEKLQSAGERAKEERLAGTDELYQQFSKAPQSKELNKYVKEKNPNIPNSDLEDIQNNVKKDRNEMMDNFYQGVTLGASPLKNVGSTIISKLAPLEAPLGEMAEKTAMPMFERLLQKLRQPLKAAKNTELFQQADKENAVRKAILDAQDQIPINPAKLSAQELMDAELRKLREQGMKQGISDEGTRIINAGK